MTDMIEELCAILRGYDSDRLMGAAVEKIVAITESECRKRERRAFVEGWEDILETDFDDEMKSLAEAEALRRYPDPEEVKK